MSKKKPHPVISIVGGMTRGNISDNTIIGHGTGGIKIGTSIDSIVSGNRIDGDDNGGIEIDKNQNSQISHNTISGEGNYGVNIRENLNSIITNNKILGSSNHGIRILENVKSFIDDNEIDSRTKDEIRDKALEDSVLNTESLLAIVDSFQLDIDSKNNLTSNLSAIERDLKSKQPELSKIQKAYLSAWKILEMVVASAIYNNSPNVATIVDGFMTRVLFLITLGQ